MNNSVLAGAETDKLCGSSVFPHRSATSPQRIQFMRFGDGAGGQGGAMGEGLLFLTALSPYFDFHMEQYSETCSTAGKQANLSRAVLA